MIGKGSKSKEPYLNLSNLTQADIAAYYLNIKSIPSLIHSPLRQDTKPSFALYCPKGTEVNYRDFSTGESGTIWTLLTKMWNCSVAEAAARVYNDLGDKSYGTKVGVSSFETRHCRINTQIDLQCKVREWRDYDLEYWGSYGISLKWLKYADVYPISHKIVIKNGISYVFGADKYAYVYVEFKEGKVTLKLNFECPMRNHRSRISLIKQLKNVSRNTLQSLVSLLSS
ncbi:DNA primase [uncultured phage cr116_1]|uniref:DNA primase n=1 Tax=uncultured phage cr116_1 TaxID=2772073 RepID=A0A7M1S0M3_9CAUD|nr:DNA primase [uncultured phage cr116_1]QOR59359.1 DNA primase [uncultured phage cr116_1]DAK53070.1 MAG TPA: DNA primase [Crassvirales sp.]